LIYAIRAVGTEYVKFGVTDNKVNRRLKGLQTGSPFELELLAQCEGGALTEDYVHRRLIDAEAHHRGEWFKSCRETDKVIAEMKAGTLNVPQSQGAADPFTHRRLGRMLKHLDTMKRELYGEHDGERADGTARAA
jgi:hypothetical protein